MEGKVAFFLDTEKVDRDEKWDVLEGYLTNSTQKMDEVLQNYMHVRKVEKAFKVAKKELKIRPVFQQKGKNRSPHLPKLSGLQGL